MRDHVHSSKSASVRVVHSGGGGGEGGATCKTDFFSNIVFEFAELFL